MKQLIQAGKPRNSNILFTQPYDVKIESEYKAYNLKHAHVSKWKQEDFCFSYPAPKNEDVEKLSNLL